MTDAHKEIFKDQKLTMTLHLNAENGNTLNHRCEALGLLRSIFTPKTYPSDAHRKSGYPGDYGTPITVYFLDGDEREFKSLAEVGDAILAKREAEKINTPSMAV